MILLVGFYQDTDPARTGEFVECLRLNCANPFIDQVVVFIECGVSAATAKGCWPPFLHHKVRLVEHRQRLTYGYLFDYASRHLRGAGVIVANADIYFDETLRLLEEADLGGRLLCLSRWDEAEDGSLVHYDNPCSQDAWIFEAPLPAMEADFCLGMPGCDNRLAYQAELAGLVVSNPSRTLRARHLHRSRVRRYSEKDRLYGPHRLVPASFLAEPSSPSQRPPERDFPSHRSRMVELQVGDRFREILKLVAPQVGGIVPRALRRELYRALCRHLSDALTPVETALAAVSFRETMGYTVAKLENGVSTHNNDKRPLTHVPEPLRGLPFTQVVANHAAPVEIVFRSAGKLYVLAAPGWEGYAVAASFLDDAGWREPFEALRTETGTLFETWSLCADSGERLLVPTQVMLVASDLVQEVGEAQ